MRQAALLSAFAAWGCGAAERLALTLPSGTEPSFVLAAFSDPFSTPFLAEARDMTEDQVFSIEGGAAVHVELLLFGSSLMSMELDSGPMALSEGGKSLPAASRTFSADLTAGAEATWRETPRAELRVDRLRFHRDRGPDPCVRLSGPITNPDTIGSRARVLPMGPQEALIAAGSSLFWYSAEGLTAGPSIECFQDGFAEDGVATVSDCQGRVWRVERAEDPRVVTSTVPGRTDWVDGSAESDGLELFSLSASGEIFEYSGGVWARAGALVGLDPDTDRVNRLGTVLRLGPANAAIVLASDSRVAFVDGSNVSFEDSGADAGLTSLLQVEGVGIVAGNAMGQFFVSRGERLDFLGEAETAFWVVSMAEFRDGFVYGTPFGNLGQWTPESGFCPLQRPVAFSIDDLVALDDDHLLLVGQSAEHVAIAELSTD